MSTVSIDAMEFGSKDSLINPSSLDLRGCLREEPHTFRSSPEPPEDMWDTDELKYLDKVKCLAYFRLTSIDLKNGRFEGFLRCKWTLRTLTLRERTEPRVRVPGIRMPRLIVKAEESRLWRELSTEKPESKSMCWHGTSMFSFVGYEIFEVQSFPFDRQIINLDLLEFVWRTDKDAATHDETMKIAYLTVTTASMMPEWASYRAIVQPLRAEKTARESGRPDDGPDHCSRFNVKIRLERKPQYYISQIFVMSYMILVASLLPLGMAPGPEHVGDRLSLHSGGLLTLVAFRFGIASDLPVVPYETFTSIWLNQQIQCLVIVMIEGLISYMVVAFSPRSSTTPKRVFNILEDFMLVGLIAGWGYKLWQSMDGGEMKKPWSYVLSNQLDYGSHPDAIDESDVPIAQKTWARGVVENVGASRRMQIPI